MKLVGSKVTRNNCVQHKKLRDGTEYKTGCIIREFFKIKRVYWTIIPLGTCKEANNKPVKKGVRNL